MMPKNKSNSTKSSSAAPHLGQRGKELQEFGTVVRLPVGLTKTACDESSKHLNGVLADTITLRDLYKKHHWQVSGPTFYQLHLLFDKHYEGQAELVDAIAERIQLLGGVSIAMAADVAETTRIERPPWGRETVPVQISRLLEAHEIILKAAHQAKENAEKTGDDGTSDLLASQIIRTNEFQVWFLSQHLVASPVTDSNSTTLDARAAAN